MSTVLAPRATLIAALLGGIVGTVAVCWVFSGPISNSETALLSPGTSTLFERYEGRLIHCRDKRDAEECLAGFEERGSKSAVLLLGNSQLHAINQYAPGDRGTSSLLFEILKPLGQDLITFSYGNANMQEHAVLLAHLIRRLPINAAVVSVVFDDTREDGVRSDVIELAKDPAVHETLASYAIGRQILQAEESDAGTPAANKASTLQDDLERQLNERLDAAVPAWRVRSEVRYQIFKNLRSFRNYVFGITPSTTRRVIPSVLANNIAALQMLLDIAKSNGVKVLLYVAPIRHDVPLPYDLAEYRAFQDQLKNVAARYGAAYANLEDLIPAQFWGLKDSTNLSSGLELDFMHFQTGGHRLLASRLAQAIQDLISN